MTGAACSVNKNDGRYASGSSIAKLVDGVPDVKFNTRFGSNM